MGCACPMTPAMWQERDFVLGMGQLWSVPKALLRRPLSPQQDAALTRLYADPELIGKGTHYELTSGALELAYGKPANDFRFVGSEGVINVSFTALTLSGPGIQQATPDQVLKGYNSVRTFANSFSRAGPSARQKSLPTAVPEMSRPSTNACCLSRWRYSVVTSGGK